MDRGAERVVRRPTAVHRRLLRRLSHSSLRAAAPRWGLARCGPRGAAGLRATHPRHRGRDGRTGLLPAGRGLPASWGRRRRGRRVPQRKPVRRPDPAGPVAALAGAGQDDASRPPSGVRLPRRPTPCAGTDVAGVRRDHARHVTMSRRRGTGARNSGEIAEVYDTAALHARCAYAAGAVHLADGSPTRRCRRCVGPGDCGATWTCRTRPPVPGCSSGWPVMPCGTKAPLRWSWTRLAMSSPSSARRQTWPESDA